jgi:hypothetical protein
MEFDRPANAMNRITVPRADSDRLCDRESDREAFEVCVGLVSLVTPFGRRAADAKVSCSTDRAKCQPDAGCNRLASPPDLLI